MGSGFLTRYRPWPDCIGARSLSHRTTKGSPNKGLFMSHSYSLLWGLPGTQASWLSPSGTCTILESFVSSQMGRRESKAFLHCHEWELTHSFHSLLLVRISHRAHLHLQGLGNLVQPWAQEVSLAGSTAKPLLQA